MPPVPPFLNLNGRGTNYEISHAVFSIYFQRPDVLRTKQLPFLNLSKMRSFRHALYKAEYIIALQNVDRPRGLRRVS